MECILVQKRSPSVEDCTKSCKRIWDWHSPSHVYWWSGMLSSTCPLGESKFLPSADMKSQRTIFFMHPMVCSKHSCMTIILYHILTLFSIGTVSCFIKFCFAEALHKFCVSCKMWQDLACQTGNFTLHRLVVHVYVKKLWLYVLAWEWAWQSISCLSASDSGTNKFHHLSDILILENETNVLLLSCWTKQDKIQQNNFLLLQCSKRNLSALWFEALNMSRLKTSTRPFQRLQH